MSTTQAPRPPASPDGSPKPRPRDPEAGEGNRISEVQDPAIAGDQKGDQPKNSYEPSVDEAGEIKPRKEPVDLLH